MKNLTWQEEREEREERERPVADKLCEFELKVLREVAGEIPPMPWGAALGQALENLKGSGYITSHFGGHLTDKGKAALAESRNA
jgi:hypothetical protein